MIITREQLKAAIETFLQAPPFGLSDAKKTVIAQLNVTDSEEHQQTLDNFYRKFHVSIPGSYIPFSEQIHLGTLKPINDELDAQLDKEKALSEDEIWKTLAHIYEKVPKTEIDTETWDKMADEKAQLIEKKEEIQHRRRKNEIKQTEIYAKKRAVLAQTPKEIIEKAESQSFYDKTKKRFNLYWNAIKETNYFTIPMIGRATLVNTLSQDISRDRRVEYIAYNDIETFKTVIGLNWLKLLNLPYTFIYFIHYFAFNGINYLCGARDVMKSSSTPWWGIILKATVAIFTIPLLFLTKLVATLSDKLIVNPFIWVGKKIWDLLPTTQAEEPLLPEIKSVAKEDRALFTPPEEEQETQPLLPNEAPKKPSLWASFTGWVSSLFTFKSARKSSTAKMDESLTQPLLSKEPEYPLNIHDNDLLEKYQLDQQPPVSSHAVDEKSLVIKQEPISQIKQTIMAPGEQPEPIIPPQESAASPKETPISQQGEAQRPKTPTEFIKHKIDKAMEACIPENDRKSTVEAWSQRKDNTAELEVSGPVADQSQEIAYYIICTFGQDSTINQKASYDIAPANSDQVLANKIQCALLACGVKLDNIQLPSHLKKIDAACEDISKQISQFQNLRNQLCPEDRSSALPLFHNSHES